MSFGAKRDVRREFTYQEQAFSSFIQVWLENGA